ncbi:unnamed protein product [Brassica rapa]|uniref:DUF1985 domain-containing protein n=1 Tax=Brassica campestris TaxID=3711 RepID=A0A8D9D3L8_BRACM|nr:unnamed protein product [Brassica rapa]
MVMDLEKVRKYPWGVAAYDLLCKSIAKNRDKLKDKTTSYVENILGELLLMTFSYALQIWETEVVPKIEKLCGKKPEKSFENNPRYTNWMEAANVSYEEIIWLDVNDEGQNMFQSNCLLDVNDEGQNLFQSNCLMDVNDEGQNLPV